MQGGVAANKEGGFWAANAALVLALFVLAACATAPKPSPGRVAAAPPPVKAAPPAKAPPLAAAPAAPGLRFSDLVGWDREDHTAALDAFRASCGVNTDPAWRDVCQKAKDLGPQDEAISRAFLETSFTLQAEGDDGLLTGYFAPEYPARAYREGEYTAPVRAKPSDLVSMDLGPLDSDLSSPRVVGRMREGQMEAYPDRAAIEKRAASEPLAWMKPEDLFFLQIQGSGVLTFPDGTRKKALFAANNGRPFVGIAAPMRDRGLLPDANTSADAIRRWLSDHRGRDADAVMRLDPRYVFFTLAPDDGLPPVGASGVALPAGRAIAIDPSRHAFGGLYWINADAPALNGAFPAYRRLTVALDAGAAIKGDVRADLYLGQGEAAGLEAGRVRHRLKMIALKPVVDPTIATADTALSGPQR